MKLLLIAPICLLGGCQTLVTTPPSNCIAFIPVGWREPIAGYPLPADDTLPAWQSFAVGQSGQLSKANDRHADTLHIVAECERRQLEARPRKKFLGIL